MKQQRRKTRESLYFNDYKELLNYLDTSDYLKAIQETHANATIDISFTCGALWLLTIIY